VINRLYNPVMVVTLDLKAEVQARLSAEAARRQMTIDQLITEFAEDLPLGSPTESPQRLSFIGIGDSGRGDLGRRHREIRKEQTAGLAARDL
jgi:hypothetical protein